MDNWKGAKDVEKQESVRGKQGNVIWGVILRGKENFDEALVYKRSWRW